MPINWQITCQTNLLPRPNKAGSTDRRQLPQDGGSASLTKSFGDWTTYGGGGYWINPGAGNQNYWFAGWLLQRKVTENLVLGGEVFHQAASVIGGKDQTGFNLGGIYDITENHHILFSAGRGIQNGTATNRFSYYVAYQLAF